MSSTGIDVIGAKENNLKNVNVSIPHGAICGICGVSGSGKSTLAIDVIANSALRNFAFGTPSFIRRKLYNFGHPAVTEVKNVPPMYLVNILNANRSSRSTVATASGLMGALRSMLAAKNGVKPSVFSYNIAQNDGGGACGKCSGTGFADAVCIEMMIADKSKSVMGGGFVYVNEKGIKHTTITEKFLQAFCDEFGIDTACALKDLPQEAMQLLLFGSNKIIKFTDRSGANGGRKEKAFPGITNALLDVYERTKNERIESCVIRAPCPACGGTRYNSKSLGFSIGGKNIAEILGMTVASSRSFVASLKGEDIAAWKREFLATADALANLCIDYVRLSRGAASLSGGEFQRIRLAHCISQEVRASCFVLDELSTGLHPADIGKLNASICNLRDCGNTVIVVEHNVCVLKNCDWIIEMGPSGGAGGGKVLYSGKSKGFFEHGKMDGLSTVQSETARRSSRESLSKPPRSLSSSLPQSSSSAALQSLPSNLSQEGHIELRNINVNNIHGQSMRLPLGKFITVAGVSGSGKSSAIEGALLPALNGFLAAGQMKDGLTIDGKIDNVTVLSQDMGVATSRSTVGTMLGVMDDVRDIFAMQAESKRHHFDKTYFTIGGERGSCPECHGKGYVLDDDEETEDVCPLCEGKRFSHDVLEIKYKGYSIADVLSLEIQQLARLSDNDKINSLLQQCTDIGVGYLSLDRTTSSLSKGEYQRLRIAKAICGGFKRTSYSRPHTTVKIKDTSLIVLDEPSKGLHADDTARIIDAIKRLTDMGNTVIAIEHNLSMIAASDYVIEFGHGAGDNGGQIVYSGQADGLMSADTMTGCALRGEIASATHSAAVHHADSDGINIKWNGSNIPIVWGKLNRIKGGASSGKSTIAREILFANSFKKYVASSNPSGKYLTRDITSMECGGQWLPVSRLVDVNQRFYKRNERISETLDLDYLLASLFSQFGHGGQPYSRNTFALGKKTLKCPVCHGQGRLMSYDIDAITHNKRLYTLMMAMLHDRTRYSRIAPLMKDVYSIDIAKDFCNMTDEEKRVFLYGDSRMEVFYAAKKKTYTWAGCNTLIHDNINFADSALSKALSGTYINRVCPLCGGNGVLGDVLNVSYRGVSFEEAINAPIDAVLSRMEKAEADSDEERLFISRLQSIVQLGLGKLHLSDYTGDLEIGDKSIVQYLMYKFNPLFGTAIIWDDFSSGKSAERIAQLYSDFEGMTAAGTTIVLFDETFDEPPKRGCGKLLPVYSLHE